MTPEKKEKLDEKIFSLFYSERKDADRIKSLMYKVNYQTEVKIVDKGNSPAL